MQIDRSLLVSCIAQNRAAQKQLYLLLLPYLRAIARRYLRDTSYTKDVLQESYVKIFSGLGHYDFEQAPIKTWAAKITINTSLNYNQRVIGHPKDEFKIDQHGTFIMPAAIDQLTKENLFFLLKQMPDGYFEVFNMSIIDGYSHEEIAGMLNISQALSRKRLSRAREWLKKTFRGKANWLEQFKSSSFLQN